MLASGTRMSHSFIVRGVLRLQPKVAEQLHIPSSGSAAICWVIVLDQPPRAGSITCTSVHILAKEFDNVDREGVGFSIKEGLYHIVAILLSHDDASALPRPYAEYLQQVKRLLELAAELCPARVCPISGHR